MNSKSRFVDWTEVEHHISSRLSFVHVVVGSPSATIFYDKSSDVLGAAVQIEDEELPSVQPFMMSVTIDNSGSRNLLRIQSQSSTPTYEFYRFIQSYLDRVQHSSERPAKIFDEVWRVWSQLFEVVGVLSDERQLGLLGELIFLDRIARSIGPSAAISYWQDEAAAEHDFGLPFADLEIKTTTNERRIHHIGSSTQLMPNPERALYLGSVHLTKAQPHAVQSFSLASQVEKVRTACKSSTARMRLDEHLKKRGYKDEDARYYNSSFVSRSVLALVRVDERCPKITIPLLEITKGTNPIRIIDINYRIDITGLGVLDGEDAFNDVISGIEV